MIPEDKIAEVRDRADIVSIVGEVVPLKRAGANWKGVCPFHQEKTPSFNVNPARQIFHCFGCHVSGDAIGFLMKLEGLSFVEAVRRLADKVGVELPADNESPRQRTEAEREARRRDRLLEVSELACKFFEQALESPAGAAARQAIDGRGISERVARQYRLGYAPDAWGALAEHLRGAAVSPAEAETLGLVKPRSSGPGHYDAFRHRLMFPVAGPGGRVIAFSGRVLEGGVTGGKTDSGLPPKYVNSPESPIYRKGETLYGLHEARVAVRRAERAILVEGNFDLLAMVERGFDNVVAPMGTAFTPAQAKVLSRSVREIVLLFDGDAAGQKAAQAAFDVVRGAGLVARVAVLPDGQDPDDLLRARGPEAMRTILEHTRGIAEFLIDQAALRCGDGHEPQARAVRELWPVLEAEPDPIGRQKLVDRIAVAFHLMPHDARRMLSGKVVAAPKPREGQAGTWPASQLALLGAALDGAVELGADLAAQLRDVLTDEALGTALDALLLSLVTTADPPRLDAPSFLEHLAEHPDLQQWAAARLVDPELEPDKVRPYLEDGVRRQKELSRRARSESLTDQIRRAQAAGDDARIEELLRAKMSLA